MKFELVVIIFKLLFHVILVRTSPDEKRLIRALLQDYERRERPVANESDPVNVKHGLSLQQIIELDLEKQILTSNIWQNIEWTDSNLKWNPSQYGNIQDIRLTLKTFGYQI